MDDRRDWWPSLAAHMLWYCACAEGRCIRGIQGSCRALQRHGWGRRCPGCDGRVAPREGNPLAAIPAPVGADGRVYSEMERGRRAGELLA